MPGLLCQTHVYFGISWDEVTKYIVATPKTVERTAALFNKFPDRFLFGTDVVAPPDEKFYLSVYIRYDPLWQAITNELISGCLMKPREK